MAVLLSLLVSGCGERQEPAGPAVEPPPSEQVAEPGFSPELEAAMKSAVAEALRATGLESGSTMRSLEDFVREANEAVHDPETGPGG